MAHQMCRLQRNANNSYDWPPPICRHLYDSMHAAQKPKRKLKFVTLEKKSNMSTLWLRKEFLRICSKKELAEKARHIKVTIPVKKNQEARYNLDPECFFINCFWGRRPDGVQSMRLCRSNIFQNWNGRQTGVPRGDRSRSKWAAQKHHQCAQRSCSEVGIWAR